MFGTMITPHTNPTETDRTAAFPDWAKRSHRSLPHVPAPRLATLNTEALTNLRPLAFLLIGRPIIAVALFVAAASQGWWIPAVVLTWLIYGSTLTAVHHLIHGGMGLSPRWRHFWLGILGCIVVESGHALQVTHLLHHRADANAPDPEGYIENLTWAELPLGALKFRYRLMAWGWKNSPRRRLVGLELAIHAALHITSLILLPTNPALWIYLSLIHFASFGFAVLAGKGPQTNYGRDIDSPFVRVQTRLGRILFFSHDKHLEHHAYPKVPLPRLPQLQDAIDQALREAGTEVIDVKMPL